MHMKGDYWGLSWLLVSSHFLPEVTHFGTDLCSWSVCSLPAKWGLSCTFEQLHLEHCFCWKRRENLRCGRIQVGYLSWASMSLYWIGDVFCSSWSERACSAEFTWCFWMKDLGQIQKQENGHHGQHSAFIVGWFCLSAHHTIHRKHGFVGNHRPGSDLTDSQVEIHLLLEGLGLGTDQPSRNPISKPN